ncbi:rRNA-binding ribosome biosynthesis protein rpf2 [Agyrium rufum]|nr:rRNA-binding ribosome biosynthesis protein rpf2 [Agyrium rufum]
MATTTTTVLREIKPKTARSARALAKRAPLPIENPKTTLFLRSSSCSSLINTLLTDFHTLRQPHSIRFSKKNENIHPFEDASSLEFFAQKNDASLLCFGSSTKKRPHHLTLVRCFDGGVLDMLELGVREETARVLGQFTGGSGKPRVGSRPMVSFSGTPFEEEELGGGSSGGSGGKFALAKSLLLDFFRAGGEQGQVKKEIDVEGLQWMINFAASEDELMDGATSGGERAQWVHMRVWKIVTKRSGSGGKLPRVEVEEMGPRLDMRLGRMQEANESRWKEAMRRAKGTEAKVKKNVETDLVGDKMGRIHLGRQELADLQTRKMKGLKRGRDALETEETNGKAATKGDAVVIGGGDDEDDSGDFLGPGSEDLEMGNEDGDDDDPDAVSDGTDGDGDDGRSGGDGGVEVKKPRLR